MRAEAKVERERGRGQRPGQFLDQCGGLCRHGALANGEHIHVRSRDQFTGSEFSHGKKDQGRVRREPLQEGLAGGFGESGQLGFGLSEDSLRKFRK
jgi:hypothetical protein